MQTAALSSLAFYILMKQMLSSPEEAARIGRALSLDQFSALTNGISAQEPANFDEMSSAIGTGLNALSIGQFPEALVLLRAAMSTFVNLIDQGHHAAAANLAEHFQPEIAKQTSWQLDLLLPLAAGLLAYQRDGAISATAHQARCDLHNQTNARLNDFVGWLNTALRPPIALPADGLVGLQDSAVRTRVNAVLDRDGYVRFDRKLPADICAAMVDFALKAHGDWELPRGAPERPSGPVRFDDPIADGLAFDTQKSLACRQVQDLVADPSLLALAQDRLGVVPNLARVTLRWSLPSPNPPSIDMAQYHHYDMDYFNFLKVFIYLTDVGESDGPHCYVRGSHRAGGKPPELLSRGYVRIPDEDIMRHYPAEDICVVTGPAGTILAGNTRCWHKGIKPSGKPRLILTVVFGDSFACGTDDLRFVLPPDCSPKLRDMIARYPMIYSRFT